MSFKKIMSFTLAAVMTLSLSAVAPGADVRGANEDPAGTEVSDETIVIGLSSEPAYLWMGGSGQVANESVIIESTLSDRLVDVDRSTGEVLPRLATEWEWVDDTHCKFKLRDDVTMSDGTPLVADDVVYSVNTWMEYSANSDTGRFLAGVEKVDDQTVTIEFNTVAPDFLSLLAWGNFGIVSEEEIDAAGGIEAATKNPVFGSGRYKFKEWVSGQHITVERNDDYWDPDYKGFFKEIKFTFTNDAAARAMAVQSGDAQVAYDMPVAMASTYQADSNIQLIVHPFGQNTRLWYNMGPKAGATADIRVRQAIDKAIDFNAVATVGTAGFGREVHGYFPEESKFYNEIFTDEERVQDLEGAKALLAEAGYENGLELSIVGMQDQNDVFVALQSMLAQVGITLSINIVDTAQFVEQANSGGYDLIHVGDLVDARYPTIFSFFREAFINSFCIGGAKWTTPEIEAAVVALIEERDEAAAKEDAKALEELLKTEMPYSNTYPELHAALTAADIKGYCTIERGFIDPTTFYR